MDAGWVQIHRSLLHHALWTGERYTRGQAWVDLILRASYTDHLALQGGRSISVRRGQVLTSQVALAHHWCWNRETVRTFLRLLNSANMIAIETSKATDTGYTLITLCNYGLYQGDGQGVLGLSSSIDSSIPPSFEPASNQHPPATINKGKKGKKNTSRVGTDAPSLLLPSSPNGHHPWPSPEALVALYNASVPQSHPRVRVLSERRQEKARRALRQFSSREFWETVFAEIGRSALLRGRRPRPGHEHFRADLDWLLTAGKDGTENVVKVAEGKYRDASPDDEDEGL